MVLHRLILAFVLILQASCAPQTDTGEVVLSYERRSTSIANLPHYRVEFSSSGIVRFFGFSGVGVPGEQVVRVSPEQFATLRQAFRDADFFRIPRLDNTSVQMHADLVTIAYRDDRRVHEILAIGRKAPQVDALRERLAQASRVIDPFINPSIGDYKRLIAGGWSINTLGTDGENALTPAVSRDPRVARFLLENGASVSQEALLSAVHGSIDLVRDLMAARTLDMNSAEARELLVRAAQHNTPVTEFLLDAGLDPNGAGREGTTPLEAAITVGDSDRVRLLLSRGADASRTPTPVIAAIQQNDSGLIPLLAHAGADVNAQDASGRTALIVASDLCRYWHIEALLAAGADPRIANREGRTALQPQIAMTGTTESCRKSLATLEQAVRVR